MTFFNKIIYMIYTNININKNLYIHMGMEK